MPRAPRRTIRQGHHHLAQHGDGDVGDGHRRRNQGAGDHDHRQPTQLGPQGAFGPEEADHDEHQCAQGGHPRGDDQSDVAEQSQAGQGDPDRIGHPSHRRRGAGGNGDAPGLDHRQHHSHGDRHQRDHYQPPAWPRQGAALRKDEDGHRRAGVVAEPGPRRDPQRPGRAGPTVGQRRARAGGAEPGRRRGDPAGQVQPPDRQLRATAGHDESGDEKAGGEAGDDELPRLFAMASHHVDHGQRHRGHEQPGGDSRQKQSQPVGTGCRSHSGLGYGRRHGSVVPYDPGESPGPAGMVVSWRRDRLRSPLRAASTLP